MSKDKDTVAEMLAWAVAAESVYPLAMALRRYADEMKRLQAELAAAKAELAAMREQRDEARREVCKMVARTRRKAGIRGQIVGLDRVTPAEIAAERGWDCYAKEGGAEWNLTSF